MARKTQGEWIEELKEQAANLAARLRVHDFHLELLDELLTKGSEASSGLTVKIAVIEERLLLLVDMKGALATIASLEKDLVAIRKDLESLQNRENELKKEKEEATRRWWSFGPNISAAVIGGLISLGTALLVLWLNKPK